MSDLGTNLLALTLARALVLELPNTREICLNDPLSPALVSELAETEALISEVLREVNILQSDMRPVNLLPVELLIHIFGFLGGGSFVIPVSHVCRRWRNVALCTPSLWTVIRESDDFLAATTFMERSNNLKLDISLQVFMNDEDFMEFQDIVAPYASRFRRLHVVVYGYRVFDFYHSLAECDLVMLALEHFSIRMIEYGFEDDSRDEELLPLCQRFVDQLGSLTELTFRGALPLREHLSHSIRSLTIADRVFDLDEMLACLEAASNLEYLALLDSVPHTFQSAQRPLVELSRLKEFHWFQGRVVDNLLGTVKLFEHLVLPGLDTSSTQFVMLLDPSKYMNSALYTPCHRFTNLFNTAVTELILEASHYASGKPARSNIVFHGRHNGETVFSVRVMRGSLGFLCVPGGMFLTSSVYVDLSKVTHLTFTSTLPYAWNRFFRTPPIWAHFLRSVPFVKVLRLHVSTPTDILKSITDASDSNSNSDSSDSPYPPPPLFIPDLQYLHLFRCGVVVVGEEEGKRRGTVCTGSSNSEKKHLLRFLATRVEFGIPIKSIVCSPEDGDGLLPAVLDRVESIEFGRPGNWAEPQFPSRMAALLEKHLN